MNIICFDHKLNGVVDTPTSAISSVLRNLGHYVIDLNYYKTLFYLKKMNFDWVMSFHENQDEILRAYNLSKKIGAKFYFHLEWIVPWKSGIFYYDRDWGYKDAYLQEYVDNFKFLSEIWDNADIRGCASKYFVKPLQRFFGSNKPICVKYPGANIDLIIFLYKYFYLNKQEILFDVCTATSLLPHKKVDMIARALVKTKRPIKWALISNSKNWDYIEKITGGTKVELTGVRCWEIPGSMYGSDVYYNMLLSKIAVHAWNGIPPNEAALCGRLPLVWDEPLQREYFNDHCEFFKDENDLAEKVNYYLDHTDEAMERAKEIQFNITYDKYTTGTTYKECLQILDNINGR